MYYLNSSASLSRQFFDDQRLVTNLKNWGIFALILGQILMATLAMNAQPTWQVQSDYFGERNAIAQTRTIRSMALSKDGSAVYTGNIQSPNVGSNAIRKVSAAAILTTPGTDHVIFGNGMPGGTGAFGQVGGQPVYAGGATGTFLGWTATGNSPRGLATDDRGYVYAALSSGISPANQVVIYSSDLSTMIATIPITGPTGVAVLKSGSTYYLYIAADTQLKRYNVTNAASPALDAGWTNTITSGAMGLTVDSDGTVFLAGGSMVRRISAAGAVTHTVTLADAADVAVYQSNIYVIKQASPAQPIVVYSKTDLSSGGSDIVVPELGAFTRGSLSQFTAIDVSADGRLWVSEENYTGGSNGIPSYTPPATSFNPAPGAITGRIYFDRVLVSSSIAAPCDVAIDNVSTTSETCPNSNDGSITITASTSAGPLTYSISGPVNASNATGIFTNLPDGNYSITVSDNGVDDCEASSSAQIITEASNALPLGWTNANIGNANGSATHDACASETGQFTLMATGFSANPDLQHSAWKTICGNGSITARVVSVDGSGWAGVEIRENAMPGSRKVALKTQLNNMVRRVIRSTTNGVPQTQQFPNPLNQSWLRITRTGNVFQFLMSSDGITWQLVGSANLVLPSCVQMGLLAESINGATTTTAVFDHVSTTGNPPAPALLTPNQGLVEMAAPDFQIYPNPSMGEVNLDLSAYADRDALLELYNAQGQLLQTRALRAGEYSIEQWDLSAYQAGIYLIKLSSADAAPVSKRVILK